jgi:hypothetical protein
MLRAFLAAGALALALPSGWADERAQGHAPPPTGAQKAASKAPGTDAQALAALRDMCAKLASAKTLRFEVHSLLPMKIAGGDWVTLVGEGTVMREGKDRLFVETGGDLYPFRFYFDGKTVTAFASKDNVYARRAEPGTIDQVLERAEKRGEVTFAFGDLVSSDPYAAMTDGIRSAVVVGTSTVDGVETQHLAVHGKELDWEIWIGTEDRLPRMVTLTDVGDPRKPTHTIRLSRWALDEAMPAGAFSFDAPADAVEVPFRDPRETRTARRPPRPPRSPRDGGSSAEERKAP